MRISALNVNYYWYDASNAAGLVIICQWIVKRLVRSIPELELLVSEIDWRSFYQCPVITYIGYMVYMYYVVTASLIDKLSMIDTALRCTSRAMGWTSHGACDNKKSRWTENKRPYDFHVLRMDWIGLVKYWPWVTVNLLSWTCAESLESVGTRYLYQWIYNEHPLMSDGIETRGYMLLCN